MSRRRALMARKAEEPAEGLGQYTRAYVADLLPTSTTSWTIQHNMGVQPKVAYIQMVDTSGVDNGYFLQGGINMQAPILVGGEIQDIGIFDYMWSGVETWYVRRNGFCTYDENALTLLPPYSTARSKFDTAKTFHVEIYG